METMHVFTFAYVVRMMDSDPKWVVWVTTLPTFEKVVVELSTCKNLLQITTSKQGQGVTVARKNSPIGGNPKQLQT